LCVCCKIESEVGVSDSENMNLGLDFDIDIKDFGKSKRQLASLTNRLPGAISQAIAYEATTLAGEIRRGIRAGAPGGQRFKALADSTIKMKGGKSKPLIEHGDLLNSVHSEKVGQDADEVSYFVGVNKHVKAKNGKDMWNIAEIHEFGTKKFDIRVTPKMRRFFYAMARAKIFKAPLNPKTTIIHHPGVPARPFLRPTFDKWKGGLSARIVKRVKKRLKIKG